MAMRYGEEFEPMGFTPEEKATELYDLKFNLGGRMSPSFIFECAEVYECAEELLQAEEAAYLVPYYTMLTEVRRLIGIDSKDQFASFLRVRTNRDLVLRYPPADVFLLVCWRAAVGCAAALLEDPLIPLDVNSNLRCGLTPLHLAAYKSSYAMTQLLLHHGADPHIYAEWNHILPLELALQNISPRCGTYLEDSPSQKTILELLWSLCVPKLKEQFDIVRLLASHSKNVEDLCFQFMNSGKILNYASLLMASWDKLMAASTEGALETTPVGHHISQVLSNASLQHEICERKFLSLSKEKLVKNLTIALDVVKTMWMFFGVLDHLRIENVPMYMVPFNLKGDLMKAAGSGDNIQCLPHKFTSEAKVPPIRNFYGKQGRPIPLMRTLNWVQKPKTTIGTSSCPSLSSFQHRSFHLLETAQVGPSACNAMALSRACAPIMWFAKKIIK